MLRRALEILKDEGPRALALRARRRLLGAQPAIFADYPRWLAAASAAPPPPPPPSGRRVDVVVPVKDPPAWTLRALAASVRAQTHDGWRLLLGDDGSRDPGLLALEAELARDPRVRVVKAQGRGISAATNAALAAGDGDLVLFADHDDLLAPDALARLAHAFDHDPRVGLAYGDEDKVDLRGRRFAPWLKPAFDPALLLRLNLLGHPVAARRDLVERVGRLRPAFDGSQDHDLALRLVEVADAVAHVPAVLYHWRALPGSTALAPNAKPWAYDAARRALEEALVRRGLAGRVEAGPFLGGHRVRLAPRVDPADVTIVTDRLAPPAWLRGPWARCEVLSGGHGTRAARRAAHAARARGRWLLLLGDVSPAGPEALDALLAEADPGLLVAGRVLDRAGRLLEHGVSHAGGGRWAVAEPTLDADDPGWYGLAVTTRSVLAASGEALLVPSGLLRELGGLDHRRFSAGGAMVDLCLRAAARGHRTVSVAEAVFAAAAPDAEGLGLAVDRAALAAAWPEPPDDPAWSPHLVRAAPTIALGERPAPPAVRVRPAR